MPPSSDKCPHWPSVGGSNGHSRSRVLGYGGGGCCGPGRPDAIAFGGGGRPSACNRVANFNRFPSCCCPWRGAGQLSPRSQEALRIIEEYANDLREIIKMLRRLLN